MVYIYDAKETNFDSLGLGTLCPTACPIVEEANGQYKLSLTHPMDDGGKWKLIIEDRIVKVPTHDGMQRFRLYKPSVDTDSGLIEVSAAHIFYDNVDNFIEDTRPTLKTGQEAGEIILAGCQYDSGFTFSSDITRLNNAYYIEKTPVQALIGPEDNSFKNRWGGIIRRNNKHIEMNERRGSDKGLRVAFRENMLGLKMSRDISGVKTRIIPKALDVNGAIFYTDAKYYDSPYINDYYAPKIGLLDTGIRVGKEVDGITQYSDVASAKTAMAEMALAAFAAGADLPEFTLKVSFLELGDTEEYAAFKDLQDKVNMDDDVTVYHSDMSIDLKMRVVMIEWDGVNDRATEITLGTDFPNYYSSAVAKDIDLSVLKAGSATFLKENERYNGVYANHEEGFVTIAEIAGHTIKTKQNSYDGFAIYDGDTYIGGVAVVDGKVANVGNMLMNGLGSDCYATIGTIDLPSYGVTNGVFVFNRNISTAEPAFVIASYDTGTTVIYNKVTGSSIQMFSSGGTQITYNSGTTSTQRVSIGANDTHINSPNLAGSVWISNTDVQLRLNGNALGIDGSGFYKWPSGGSRIPL